jgi:ribonuclease HI
MYDVVYTDGACKGNGKAGSVAGIGVWWGRNDPRLVPAELKMYILEIAVFL